MFKIHHLNCGTMYVPFGVAIIGTGGLFKPAYGVTHCILLETDDGLLLVDSGHGSQDFAAPTPLMNMFLTMSQSPGDPQETALAQISQLGYDPRDVRHIVLTHFHFDHAGGLPDFPQAQVHLYEEEYRGVMQPRDMLEHLVFRREHWTHGPKWEIHNLKGDQWFGLSCTPWVDLRSTRFCLVPMPGHTRGISAVVLERPNGWLVHCGDIYAYHGDVDPDNPHKPPYYGLLRYYFGMSKAFRAIGRHSPRLRQLLIEHGDEVRLTCSHDPVELDKMKTLG